MTIVRGALLLVLGGIAVASADVVEPKTGQRFSEKGLSRLGVRVSHHGGISNAHALTTVALPETLAHAAALMLAHAHNSTRGPSKCTRLVSTMMASTSSK